MFNRPGPRLVDALEFLVGLLHAREDLIPQGFPWEWWVQPGEEVLITGGSAAATAAAVEGAGEHEETEAVLGKEVAAAGGAVEVIATPAAPLDDGA